MKINQPQQVWRLYFQGEWPTAVAFLDSNGRLAAANRGGQIYVWDLASEPKPSADAKASTESPNSFPTLRLDGHTNGVTHLRALDGGRVLASASLDHSVRLWELDSPPNGKDEAVLDRQVREQQARKLPQAERESFLQSPGVQVNTLSTHETLAGHDGWVNGLGIDATGSRLISGDDKCLAIVWDLAKRKQLASWRGADRVWVRSAALSPDGRTAFTCEYAGRRSSFDAPAAQVRLWNVDDGSVKRDLLKIWTPKIKDEDRDDSYGYWKKWSALLKRGLVCADFSPDGKLLAVGQGGETDKGKAHLVDVESGEIVRTVSEHQNGVCDVRFSADSRYVLTSGRDTTVKISEVASGELVATLGKPRGGQFKDWFYSLAISPDQSAVAAADIAGFIHVWRLAT